jgi:hypothetical protein
MRVRPLDEAVRRYVLRSTEAFLGGAQNERWIVGVLSHSGLDLPATAALIHPLCATSPFRDRAAFLQRWLHDE